MRYDHLPLETRDGRRIEVEFVSNVYRVDQRHVAQCNIRDISERNRMEKKLQAQSDELSDLHRRKDEFLAMLSHELRNPLASMINAVELLRLQKLSENGIQQRSRTILERQLGDLKHLVDDLLEVSRITTGRIRLRQELVPFADIVEGALQTVRPIMENRRHQFIVNVPIEPVWLIADPARLGQVLVNLLTNAAKYTDEGGRVWLEVRREKETCVVSVRDTGIGIAAELLPRIFDLFTQAERLTDRSQGGLGIGLCLVQRLVELHGGTVEARSVVGEGSEFIVRVPASKAPAARAKSAETAAAVSSRRHVRVLVVDDDVDMAESTAIILRESGHDVRTAHNGSSALQLALEFMPHAVLLDIGLPGMSGHEVARRMREFPALKSTIIVAVTGYGQENDSRISREAGFNHHLVKPAEYEEIHLILDSIEPACTYEGREWHPELRHWSPELRVWRMTCGYACGAGTSPAFAGTTRHRHTRSSGDQVRSWGCDSRSRKAERPAGIFPAGRSILVARRECYSSSSVRLFGAPLPASSAANDVSALGRSGNPGNPSGAAGTSSPSMSTSWYRYIPVPAGMRCPMMMFSLRPRRSSRAPRIAASVSTRVVSWKLAAEMNDCVVRLAFVMPSKAARKRRAPRSSSCGARSSRGTRPCRRSLPRASPSRPDPRSAPSAASGARSRRCACR